MLAYRFVVWNSCLQQSLPETVQIANLNVLFINNEIISLVV